MEYDFTLKFKLTDPGLSGDEIVERLGAGGCDDALVGVGTPGRVGLHFTRGARSAQAAIQSALADVRRALPGAELLEAGPDYVGLTDVADLVGVSRQNVRKLMLAHANSFPPPIHDGSASVWHLAPLLKWFNARTLYRIDAAVLEAALAAMTINIIKEATHMPAAVRRNLRILGTNPHQQVLRPTKSEGRLYTTARHHGGKFAYRNGRAPFLSFINRYLHG